jgi:hypothetical protein
MDHKNPFSKLLDCSVRERNMRQIHTIEIFCSILFTRSQILYTSPMPQLTLVLIFKLLPAVLLMLACRSLGRYIVTLLLASWVLVTVLRGVFPTFS